MVKYMIKTQPIKKNNKFCAVGRLAFLFHLFFIFYGGRGDKKQHFFHPTTEFNVQDKDFFKGLLSPHIV